MHEILVALIALTLVLSSCDRSSDAPRPAAGGDGGKANRARTEVPAGAEESTSLSEQIRSRVQSGKGRLDPFVPQGRRGDSATKPDSRRLPSNLEFSVLQDGTGEPPAPDSSIQLHLTGWVRIGNILGKRFWDSRDDRRPHEYRLNKEELIEGLVQAVSAMKKGERRWVNVPSNLAYGEQGYPNVVPPRADLVFDVELVDYSAPISR